MELGVDNKKKVIWASVLGGIAVLLALYRFIPLSSTTASSPASTTSPTQISATSPNPPGPASRNSPTRSGARRSTGPSDKDKKAHPQNLDPMLHLAQLAAAEQVKYEGSGRNIFVSQADSPIPIAASNGTTDHKENPVYTPPTPAPPPPIPLKFFGFASGPGEPKRIFLSKGDDVFIVGEGEIVDRRYKVLHISPTSVEMQDVVGSGPPQSLPLVQG
ncbi:MAG: hypothetical protein WB562_07565 [Candidatus Sulfotelmatobacter sp.]